MCTDFSHSLMQRGPPMRKHVAQHPMHLRALRNVFDLGAGRKVRTNVEGTIAKGLYGPKTPAPNQTQVILQHKQKKSDW